MKLRLLSDWQHKSTQYKKGELLEVDDSIGELLVKTGIAQTETVQPQETKDVVKIGDGGTQTSQPINNLDDVRDVVVKALADVLKSDKSANSGRPPINTHDRILDDPLRGYKEHGFGEFLMDVKNATLNPAKTPERLRACMSTKAVGSDEYTTVDNTLGGYFIAPSFSDLLMTKGIEPEFVVSNGAPVFPVAGGILYINAETDITRTSTLYGGIQVYWQKERQTMTATKGNFEQIELKPKMLTGLTYVTDNLLHNHQAMGQILARQFRDAMVFKRMNAFINGGGDGEPLGVLNSDCLISVTKETGQAAATINSANIWNMWSRMRAQEFENAVWLASNSCKPQLMQLSLAVGTGGAPLMSFNIGNTTQTTLLGRPLIFTEQCQAVGTVGDIILASWPHYVIGETSYQRSDSSIHIRFESNETAFRFVQMVDGQPWWRTTLTLKENLTVSPFVALATRS